MQPPQNPNENTWQVQQSKTNFPEISPEIHTKAYKKQAKSSKIHFCENQHFSRGGKNPKENFSPIFTPVVSDQELCSKLRLTQETDPFHGKIGGLYAASTNH